MIHLISEDRTYSFKKSVLKKSIKDLIHQELYECGDVSVIFCSDEYLLDINRRHLKHNYFTDIITFDYTVDRLISGDLFVSLDRLRENATVLGVPLQHELCRIVFHGVLHLCGYKDKSVSDKQIMTTKEDYYLNLLGFNI